MSNTSATGGYLNPSSSQGLPGGLTLEQFIQTVIAGISGFAGVNVRPKWQVAPPKQPDIAANWISFGIMDAQQDSFAFTGSNDAGSSTLNTQRRLEVQITIYGPAALENISILQDGFQIQQNLEAMRAALISFIGFTKALRFPELINERWFNRWDTTLALSYQTLRTYPVLSFASAGGSIHTVVEGQDYSTTWQTPDPP